MDEIFWQQQKSTFIFPLESDDVKDSELADDLNLTDNVKSQINYIDDCDSTVNDVDDFIDDDNVGKMDSEHEDSKVPKGVQLQTTRRKENGKCLQKMIYCKFCLNRFVRIKDHYKNKHFMEQDDFQLISFDNKKILMDEREEGGEEGREGERGWRKEEWILSIS